MESKKVELLYKKNLGLPYSVPGAGANSESGNSRPFIQSGRIMNQAIPASVVATDFSPATNAVTLDSSASYVRDATMSYIKYYFITLGSIKRGFSYTSPLLSQAIPFNYDKGGSYKYYVYASGINNGNQILQDDTNYSWIVDPDAGILTFFNSVGDTATVTISFYRYEGTFGVGGGGGIPNIPSTQIVYMGPSGLTGSSLVTVDSLGKLNAGNLYNSFLTYANTFTQSTTASSVNYYGALWAGSVAGLVFDISGMGATFFANTSFKQLVYVPNVNEPTSATFDLLITPGSFGTATTNFTVQIGIGIAAGYPICRIRYKSIIGATTGYTISVTDPSDNTLKSEPITANNSTARPLKIVVSSKSITIYDNGNPLYTGSNTNFGTTVEFRSVISIYIAVNYTVAPRVSNFSVTSNYNPTTHALLSGGDILPTIPSSYNLGSVQIPFNSLYVSNIQTPKVATTQISYMGSAGLTGSSLVTVDSLGKLNAGASSTSTILAYSNTLTSSLVGHSVNYYGASLTGAGFSFGPSGMSSPANTTPVATYIGGVNEAIDATINFSVIPGNCVSAVAGAVAYSRVSIYDTSGSRYFTIEYSAERSAVNSFKRSIYDSTRTPSLISSFSLTQSNSLARPVKIVRSSNSIAFYDISFNAILPFITIPAVIGNKITISIFNDGGVPATISNFSVTPTYIPLNYALFSGGDIVPKLSTTYNLGSAPNPFNSLFVSNIQTGSAIAIGSSAGFTGQGGSAVAIGNQAGYSGQGANSIAIGSLAGVSGQAPNSIILNASGATLNANTSGTFIAPIRPAGTTFTLNYNPLTNEVSYNSALALTALVANTQVAYMSPAGLTGSSLVTVDTRGKLNIGASNITTIQSYANDFKTNLANNSVNLYGSTFTGSGFSFGTSGMISSTLENGNSAAVATYIGGANESVSAEINVTVVPGVCSPVISANTVNTQILIYDSGGSRYFRMQYSVAKNVTANFVLTLTDSSGKFTTITKSITESVLNARTVKIIRSPTSIAFLDNGVVLYTVTGTDIGTTVIGKQIQLGIVGFIGPTRSSFNNFSVTSNYVPPNYALFTGGDIVPNLSTTYNLGSTVNHFNSLYISNINSLYARLSTTNSIAIGDSTAGSFSQQISAVAIGNLAGVTSQQTAAVAIGYEAGSSGQGSNSIAIGAAGKNQQGISAVAIGNSAGQTTQGNSAVAIGTQAGQTNQLDNAVAIGPNAGLTGQQDSAIAIGKEAGYSIQGSNAVAVGNQAGRVRQDGAAVAIGNQAGASGQGANSIAIGSLAGFTGQAANSIILNASGLTLSAGTSGTFIAPIRPIGTATLLNYNPATSEVSYNPAITSTQVAYMGAAGLTGSSFVTVDSQGRLNVGVYNAPTVTWVSYENTLTTGFADSNINYYGGMWASSGNAPEFYNTGLLGLSVSLINTTATYTGGSNESVAALINLMLAIGYSNGAANSIDIIFWDINNRSFTFKFSTASSATAPTSYAVTVIDSNGTASLPPVTITGSAVFSHSVKFVRASNRLACFDNNRLIADVSGAQIGTSVIGKRIDIVITTGFFTNLKARAAVSNFSITSDYIPITHAVLAGGDILPNASTTYNLGAQQLPFNSLYVSNIQTGSSVAIGNNAGFTGQGGATGGAIAIGNQAGASGQGANSIAIGSLAGYTGQATNSIILNATGVTLSAGTSGTFIAPIRPIGTASVLNYNPSTYEISYTPALSLTTQGTTGVTGQFLISQNVAGATAIFNQPVLGYLGAAGITTYGNAINSLYSRMSTINSIAIGDVTTGSVSQKTSAIAIGNSAGQNNQGVSAVALGTQAGQINQMDNAVAIGFNAGLTGQQMNAIAVGYQAGYNTQQINSVAIGNGAGAVRQGGATGGAIAIGNQAGASGQGANSIAIGSLAGASNQFANSIILNASGRTLSAGTSGTFIAPIRSAGATSNLLYYNIGTNEVSYTPLTVASTQFAYMGSSGLTGSRNLTIDSSNNITVGPYVNYNSEYLVYSNNFANGQTAPTTNLIQGSWINTGTKGFLYNANGAYFPASAGPNNNTNSDLYAYFTNNGIIPATISFTAIPGSGDNGNRDSSISFYIFLNNNTNFYYIKYINQFTVTQGSITIYDPSGSILAGNATVGASSGIPFIDPTISRNITIVRTASTISFYDNSGTPFYTASVPAKWVLGSTIGIGGFNRGAAPPQGWTPSTFKSLSISSILSIPTNTSMFVGGNLLPNMPGQYSLGSSTIPYSNVFTQNLSVSKLQSQNQPNFLTYNTLSGTIGYNAVGNNTQFIYNNAGNLSGSSNLLLANSLLTATPAFSSVPSGTVVYSNNFQTTPPNGPQTNTVNGTIGITNTNVTYSIRYDAAGMIFPSFADGSVTFTCSTALGDNIVTLTFLPRDCTGTNYATFRVYTTGGVYYQLEYYWSTSSNITISLKNPANVSLPTSISFYTPSFYNVTRVIQIMRTRIGFTIYDAGVQLASVVDSSLSSTFVFYGKVGGNMFALPNYRVLSLSVSTLPGFPITTALALGGDLVPNTSNTFYLGAQNYPFKTLFTNNIQTSGAGIAIGPNAALSAVQGANAISIGNSAGLTSQQPAAVAIGYEAGASGQGSNSIAIGAAGKSQQGISAVAIGNAAGQTTQGNSAVAIGTQAGQTNQLDNAVAIGFNAGLTGQRMNTIAVGYQAGNNTQQINSVAIGSGAGALRQGGAIGSAIAIGNQAGASGQGANSIAIGSLAGFTGQAANSIILNATGITMTAGTSGTFIAPIRQVGTTFALNYNPTTNEVSYTPLTVANTQVAYMGASGLTGSPLMTVDSLGQLNVGVYNNPPPIISYSNNLTPSRDPSINVYSSTFTSSGNFFSNPSGMYNFAPSSGAIASYRNGANEPVAATITLSLTPGSGNIQTQTGNIATFYQVKSFIRIWDTTNSRYFTITYNGYTADGVIGSPYTKTYKITVEDSNSALPLYAEATPNPGISPEIPHEITIIRSSNGFILKDINTTIYTVNATLLGTSRIGQKIDLFSNTGFNYVSIPTYFKNFQVVTAYNPGSLALSAGGNILPNLANAYNLGDPILPFNTLYTKNIQTSGDGIAIGPQAALSAVQGANAISIGTSAGYIGQTEKSIAIGANAGATGQGLSGVNLGAAIAIGFNAGATGQGRGGIAIGHQAGQFDQGASGEGWSIAIGANAGLRGQGSNSIAIGSNAGTNNLPANTIILNATGGDVGGYTIGNTTYIKPVRNGMTSPTIILGYNATTGEVTYGPHSSDLRLKTDISGTKLGLDFINALNPVEFRWKDRENGNLFDSCGNLVISSNPGKRLHQGFIAQEVKATLDSFGADSGIFFNISDGPIEINGLNGLRHNEMIAPIVKAVQEQSKMIQLLQQQVAALQKLCGLSPTGATGVQGQE